MAFLEQTYLGNTILQYLLFLGILVGAVLAGKVVTWFSKTILKSFAHKTKTQADDLIIEILEAPVLFTVFLVAMWLARETLWMSDIVRDVYNKLFGILIIINVAWYIARFISGVISHYVQPLTAKTKTDLDDHLLPIAKRLVNITVVIIAGIMIIDKLGYNVGSLLAGVGLGGLAFALAAQDLVANLFGGVAILTDKPFKIGDRIKIGEVDGYVREIGLRTTRVETFGGTMMVMPNSKVVDSVTENVSAEKQRRMVMTIGVEYGTSSAKLERGKKIVEQHIKKIKGLDHESFKVSFAEFAASSLDIRVQYWITKKGMDDYFGVQDKLLLGIKKDFEKAKIDMAFPTQTVHVKK